MPPIALQDPVSRRIIVLGSLAFLASSSIAVAKDGEGEGAVRDRLARLQRLGDPFSKKDIINRNEPLTSDDANYIFDEPTDENSEYYDPALLPPKESEFDYPIEPTDRSQINSVYWRQVVNFAGPEEPGTIIVDPKAHFLYHVLSGGQATRYGVGVGRAGFAWAGIAEIRMKRRWPRWVPPHEMAARDKRAQKWANGQPGGPGNPLGARALYLYSDGKDTLYRIHGTTEPSSIGKSVSSGCIRMLNEDVADLFDNVEIGTKVIVR